MSGASVKPAARVTVIVFSSRPDTDPAGWLARFDRYRAEAGLERTLQLRAGAEAVPGESEWVVLWDAAAGIPPKEIEGLIESLGADEWRAGVRWTGPVPPRNIHRGVRWMSRLAAHAARLLGQPSDVCPPCLAIPAEDWEACRSALPAIPPARWIPALLQAARRRRKKLSERPVMWRQP